MLFLYFVEYLFPHKIYFVWVLQNVTIIRIIFDSLNKKKNYEFKFIIKLLRILLKLQSVIKKFLRHFFLLV